MTGESVVTCVKGSKKYLSKIKKNDDSYHEQTSSGGFSV